MAGAGTAGRTVASAGPGRSAAWRLRLRRSRLPAGYLTFVLAAVAALIAAPYGEELWRGATADKR